MSSTSVRTAPSTHVTDLGLCDRCGVAGKIRYTLLSLNDLVLCGHHAYEFGPALSQQSLAIEDLTVTRPASTSYPDVPDAGAVTGGF